MSTKHTPGPWVAVFSGNDRWSWHGWTIIANGYRLPLSSAEGDDEECEANAHLIEAAPDLLEALQDLLYAEQGYPWGGYSEEEIAARAKANAAIAKATQSPRTETANG